jgi:RNA polymerase sigma-70 factor (ECF subfamily)
VTVGTGPGEASFEAFYEACRDRLARQLFVITGDMGVAMECVQEGFTRAWARWPVVSKYEQPEAWVRRVALNVAVSRWRRTRRTELRAAVEPGAAVGPTLDRVVLSTALAALPGRQRVAVVLHHLVDLPVDEVARQMGIPVGTAKSLLVRGRRRLATVVGPVAP